MTKSVKVKIILITTFLTISALIMTYKYFTEFKQTQIDREEQEEQKVAWDSPINQFEFASPREAQEQEEQKEQQNSSISKIDLNQKAFVKFQYSTQPFVKTTNAKELAQKIAYYGKDPAIQNFIKDMKAATGHTGEHFDTLPSVEEIKKQMASTQTQKILLQYSKDPAFRKAVQRIMQDPEFMTGFINYINQPEQKTSSK